MVEATSPQRGERTPEVISELFITLPAPQRGEGNKVKLCFPRLQAPKHRRCRVALSAYRFAYRLGGKKIAS